MTRIWAGTKIPFAIYTQKVLSTAMHFGYLGGIARYVEKHLDSRCSRRLAANKRLLYWSGTRMVITFTAIQSEYSYLQKPSVVNVYDSYIR